MANDGCDIFFLFRGYPLKWMALLCRTCDYHELAEYPIGPDLQAETVLLAMQEHMAASKKEQEELLANEWADVIKAIDARGRA